MEAQNTFSILGVGKEYLGHPIKVFRTSDRRVDEVRLVTCSDGHDAVVL